MKKSNGKLYWRDTAGDVLAESDLAGNLTEEFIFFDGRRAARRDVSTNAVHYYFSDHLGSADVDTNATGTIDEESDFRPFGEESVVTDAGIEYRLVLSDWKPAAERIIFCKRVSTKMERYSQFHDGYLEGLWTDGKTVHVFLSTDTKDPIHRSR